MVGGSLCKAWKISPFRGKSRLTADSKTCRFSDMHILRRADLSAAALNLSLGTPSTSHQKELVAFAAIGLSPRVINIGWIEGQIRSKEAYMYQR